MLIKHSVLGDMVMEVDVGPEGDLPDLLFTENDTNHELLYGGTNATPYVKDAFHNYVVKGWLYLHVERIRNDLFGVCVCGGGVT